MQKLDSLDYSSRAVLTRHRVFCIMPTIAVHDHLFRWRVHRFVVRSLKSITMACHGIKFLPDPGNVRNTRFRKRSLLVSFKDGSIALGRQAFDFPAGPPVRDGPPCPEQNPYDHQTDCCLQPNW